MLDHYELPAELFELFLDQDFRAYSAGRWQDGDTLEIAQGRNQAGIILALNIAPSSAVLDVGCGWGALAQACHGVRRYVGLSPSAAQIAYIRQRFPDAELWQASWQHFKPLWGSIDAVVANEVIEHIPPQDYHRFFEYAADCSTASARLYLQTTLVRRPPRTRSERLDAAFILLRVFPGSTLADLASLEKATSGIYRPESIADPSFSTEDYLLTLHAWHSRLYDSRYDCVHQFGLETYKFFDRYFLACIHLFESEVVTLMRATLTKRSIR